MKQDEKDLEDLKEECHIYQEKDDAAGIFNPSHIIFIREMAAHGNRREAYQMAYPKASNASARVNAARLMAKEHIASAIRVRRVNMEKQRLEVLHMSYSSAGLITIEEKRKLLASIIRGDVVTEVPVIRNGELQTLKKKPDLKERLRAMQLDNELEAPWLNALNLPDKM